MAARSLRIDVLRGIAVFGILLINVWSVVYGNETDRYGPLDSAAGGIDRLLVYFAAAFAEQKFYPIFAFLFGAGFALQTGGLRAPGPERNEIAATYGRRIRWLLACGVVHGSLIWYGDILTIYAITAFWLMNKVGRRLGSLLQSLRGVIVLDVLCFLFTVLIFASVSFLDLPDHAQARQDALASFTTYTQGSWGAIALLRVRDYLGNQLNSILFMPRVALLFLAGVFAVRLGWLTRPERHRRLWLRVAAAGLGIGLPLNLWWGYVVLQQSSVPPVPVFGGDYAYLVIEQAGPCLAAGYIGLMMLTRNGLLALLGSIFAPVGRMALSNYLGQSVLCTFLLQGWGLGLGAVLSRWQLLALCGSIMLVQIVFSRWWLARHAQGPVEAVWRRYTYRPRGEEKDGAGV